MTSPLRETPLPYALAWLDNNDLDHCTCPQCRRQSQPPPPPPSSSPASLVFIILIGLLFRLLIASHPYSGYQTPPMYGDYEAQRHWMEVTLNVNTSAWYTYDVEYWGLDYPPLTAYHSLALGYMAQWWDPAMVALDVSRGYESPHSKLFMRWSVVLCDLLIWLPAAYLFSSTYFQHACMYTQRVCFLILTIFPALLLIDHGHFQYNSVTLGLSLVTFALVSKHQTGGTTITVRDDVIAAIAFCAAIMFKQMSLYFAPAVFFIMLRRCFLPPRHTFIDGCAHVLILGITVITTMTLILLPLIMTASSSSSSSSWSSVAMDTLRMVGARVFPFNRGLYEDKVANIWCSLSLAPVAWLKLKQVVAREVMVRVCTLATFIAFTPAAIHVFFFLPRQQPHSQPRQQHARRFIHVIAATAWSFFLFGFQVHEKSVLMPLLPMMVLMVDEPMIVRRACIQLAIVANASMFPLLRRDGLVIPYICMQVLLYLLMHVHTSVSVTSGYSAWVHKFIRLSLTGVIGIHIIDIVAPTPSRYPDLKTYMFTTFACAHFILAWLYTSFAPFYFSTTTVTKTKQG